MRYKAEEVIREKLNVLSYELRKITGERHFEKDINEAKSLLTKVESEEERKLGLQMQITEIDYESDL